MYYIRVPDCYDNLRLLESVRGKTRCYAYDGNILVGGELYTPREYAVMRERYVNMPPLHRHYFCSVKKEDTYWFFGARFIVEGAKFLPSIEYSVYKAHCKKHKINNPIDK